MIIKKPEDRDIPGLRRLWQQAFGDTDAFLDTFFRVGFSYERCFCICQEGVVAALYWFDCSWGDKKVAYIYAVATEENHRGQGLCRRLLEHTHKQLQKMGYQGAALVPGGEELIGFYEKFGYRGFCPMKRMSAQSLPVAEEITSEHYRLLRQEQLCGDALLHSKQGLGLLDTYGSFYKGENALFCGYWESGTFHFEEVLGALDVPQKTFSQAMYLPLDGTNTQPDYFAIPLI